MFKTLKRIAIAIEQNNIVHERILSEMTIQTCYLKEIYKSLDKPKITLTDGSFKPVFKIRDSGSGGEISDAKL